MITVILALSDVARSVQWKQKVSFPACSCDVGLPMADLFEVAQGPTLSIRAPLQRKWKTVKASSLSALSVPLCSEHVTMFKHLFRSLGDNRCSIMDYFAVLLLAVILVLEGKPPFSSRWIWLTVPAVSSDPGVVLGSQVEQRTVCVYICTSLCILTR